VNRHRYGSGRPFNDLLFNSLLAFAALLFLTFILIKPQATSQKKLESKAEFVITVTWSDSASDDVDVYVRDPDDRLVYFQRREDGLMHLDRDDLGRKNDKIVGPDGEEIIFDYNREVVTIRGSVAGEYIVNVHMSRKEEGTPTTVTVQLEKMNPFDTVTVKRVVLNESGDEKTALRFIVNSEGEVLSVNDLQTKLTIGDHYDDEYEEEDYTP